MRTLPRIAQRVLGAPLAIAPEKLEAVLSVLGARIGLDVPAPSAWHDDEEDGAAPPAPPYTVSDGVALVRAHGLMVQRSSYLDALSGLVGYDEILERVSAAYVDDAVRAIVLEIDSYGGEVAGITGLADYVAAVAREKPMVAIANEAAYSAGYWLASAAGRVMLPITGGVGSIGVVATHVDRSGEDAQRGHAYTFIHAGALKVDGNSHAPLSDSTRARIQQRVDATAALFHAHVAAMRGMTAEAVAAQQAGTFHGADAIAAGLADRIGGLGDALAWARALAGERGRTTNPLRGGSPRAGSEGGPMTTANQPEAPASAAEPPAPAASATDAVAAERGRVREIAELCKLAGSPALAADFIAEGKSVASVRAALLEQKAAADEKRDIVAAKGGDAPKRGTARLPDPYAIYQRRAAQAAGRKEA